MAKISANYEVVYIIDPAQGEEAVAAIVAKFQTLAEQHASNVVVDEWGKRRLAYAIDYKTEGYYVLMSFTSAPVAPRIPTLNCFILQLPPLQSCHTGREWPVQNLFPPRPR